VIRGLDALQQVEANFQAEAFYSAADLRRMLRKPCVIPPCAGRLAAVRFQAEHSNDCWQCDLRF
jgi:hypothetical protein